MQTRNTKIGIGCWLWQQRPSQINLIKFVNLSADRTLERETFQKEIQNSFKQIRNTEIQKKEEAIGCGSRGPARSI